MIQSTTRIRVLLTIVLFIVLGGVSAAFAAAPPKVLTISIQGAGQVLLDPPGGAYARGTAVSMTAIPDAGWNFDHWEGPTVSGSTDNPQVITMYNNYDVTAVFSRPTGVDLYRKRDAVVQVIDAQGQPVPAAAVDIEQVRRSFPFGVAVTNQLVVNSKYKSFVRQHSPHWWDWAVFGNEAKWYANEGAQGIVSY